MITLMAGWRTQENFCKSPVGGKWFTNFLRVLASSRIGFWAGKPIVSVVCCFYETKLILKQKNFHGLSSAQNYWLLTNQENCGISVELPLRAYITLTFGKSTMCFVEGKTSCVCADMFVDWNSCLCWTLWIQNSRWVLSHFMWTVISLLKSNFLIIENLPYIAGIAANKWVEFSISRLSLLLVWWTA